MKSYAAAAFALLVLGGCSGPKDVVWSFATPRPWFLAGDSQALTPTVEGDTVFFCGGYGEKQRAQIYALDAASGKAKWQYNIGSCGAPPLLAAGAVISFGFAANGDHIVIYGLDRESGRQKWKLELPGNPHPPPPVALGDFVFFAPGSRSVLRIDARDGSVQSFDIDADLSVAAESLWVAGAKEAAVFGYGKSWWRSRIDGDKVEDGPALSEPAGRPVAAATDGHILLLGDEDGGLRAFDLAKGSVVWRQTWKKILSAPALAEGTVFLGVYQEKPMVAAVALDSGKLLWEIPEGDSAEAPYWRDGRLYVASGTSVLAVDGATGKIQARLTAPTGVTTSAVPFGDLVLFGTAKGVVYAEHWPHGH